MEQYLDLHKNGANIIGTIVGEHNGAFAAERRENHIMEYDLHENGKLVTELMIENYIMLYWKTGQD